MTLMLQHPFWKVPSLRRKGSDGHPAFAPIARFVPRPVADDPDPGQADAQAWSGRSILFCGPFHRCGPEMRCWLGRVGALTCSVGEMLMPFEWIERHAAGFDAVIVDCDQFADAEDVVDFGLRLRGIAPHLPVVMASSTVARNDFGMERRAICDATLRKPVSRSAFLIGIGVAMSNRKTALAAALGA